MRWDESGRDDNGLDESGPYEGGWGVSGREGDDGATRRAEMPGALSSPWGVWSGPGVADVPGAARRAAAREAAAARPPRSLPRWRVPGGAARAVLVLVGLLAVLLAVRAAGSGGEVTGLGPVSQDAASHSGHDGTGHGTAEGTHHGSRAPASGPAGAVATGGATAPAAPGEGSSAAPGGQAGPSAGGPTLVVHVVGRVRRPGTARLVPGSRVEDALRAAGGVASGADLTALNLARPLQDGEQVHVPRPGELPCGPAGAAAAGAAGSAAGAAGSSEGGAAGTAGAAPVDLNTADISALDELPGIGPVLADRIVAWRTEHGRFSSVDELGEVSGIGESLLSRLRPLVRV